MAIDPKSPQGTQNPPPEQEPDFKLALPKGMERPERSRGEAGAKAGVSAVSREKKENRATLREGADFSVIKGLDTTGHNLPTNVPVFGDGSRLRFREGHGRMARLRRIGLVLAVVVAVAGAVLARWPAGRARVLTWVGMSSRVAPEAGVITSKCAEILRRTTGAGGDQDPQLAARAAECRLLQDAPELALRQSRAIQDKGAGVSVDAGLVLVDVLLRAGKWSEAGRLAEGFCPRWEHSPRCLARLQVAHAMGYRGASEEGWKRLGRWERAEWTAAQKARAWLYWSEFQSARGDLAPAREAWSALAATRPPEPTHAYLWREMSSSRVIAAYRAGDRPAIQKVLGESRRVLGEELQSGFQIKTRLWLGMLDQKGLGERLDSFFRRPENSFRLRGDSSFLEALTVPAIYAGRAGGLYSYAARVAGFFEKEFGTPNIHAARARIVMARSRIASGQTREARRELDQVMRQHGETLESAHLLGVTWFVEAASQKEYRRALEAFQRAATLRETSTSLLALGFSATRASRVDLAERALGRMAHVEISPRDKKWEKALRAEVAALKNKSVRGRPGLAMKGREYFNSPAGALAMAKGLD